MQGAQLAARKERVFNDPTLDDDDAVECVNERNACQFNTNPLMLTPLVNQQRDRHFLQVTMMTAMDKRRIQLIPERQKS